MAGLKPCPPKINVRALSQNILHPVPPCGTRPGRDKLRPPLQPPSRKQTMPGWRPALRPKLNAGLNWRRKVAATFGAHIANTATYAPPVKLNAGLKAGAARAKRFADVQRIAGGKGAAGAGFGALGIGKLRLGTRKVSGFQEIPSPGLRNSPTPPRLHGLAF